MTAVLIRGGLTHTGPQGRRPCEDGSRDYNNVSSNRGMSRVAESQRLGIDMEELFPMASEGAWFC